ncbi:Uncharacterized protein APZ42_009584 [Daphnia magna]|uniref:Uncharacterized protein n=1 Tax=Daphnia magna TaxID=35525 RepID=A0A162BQL7_9CRUS|nr:Uncharacterized protein APZ42_009584 [Daphnia magna]
MSFRETSSMSSRPNVRSTARHAKAHMPHWTWYPFTSNWSVPSSLILTGSELLCPITTTSPTFN